MLRAPGDVTAFFIAVSSAGCGGASPRDVPPTPVHVVVLPPARTATDGGAESEAPTDAGTQSVGNPGPMDLGGWRSQLTEVSLESRGGLAPDAVHRFLPATAYRYWKRCFENALAHNRGLRGELLVHFVIASGEHGPFDLSSDTLPSDVISCAPRVGGLYFPSAPATDVVLRVEIHGLSHEEAAASFKSCPDGVKEIAPERDELCMDARVYGEGPLGNCIASLKGSFWLRDEAAEQGYPDAGGGGEIACWRRNRGH